MQQYLFSVCLCSVLQLQRHWFPRLEHRNHGRTRAATRSRVRSRSMHNESWPALQSIFACPSCVTGPGTSAHPAWILCNQSFSTCHQPGNSSTLHTYAVRSTNRGAFEESTWAFPMRVLQIPGKEMELASTSKKPRVSNRKQMS